MNNYISRFIDDSKFFVGDFHKGTVNILFHIVSVISLIYGIANKDLLFAFLGLAVFDELGHIYNYLYLHKKDPKYNPLRMLPYQIIYVIPPAFILFKAYGLI